MFTDLFVHRVTRLISAMGVRYPARVVGGGGIYLEYDGRDVPDVATIVADYDEGCQLLITATMINDYPIEEVIRGHSATVKFGSQADHAQRPKRDRLGLRSDPAERRQSPAARRRPAQREAVWHGERDVRRRFRQAALGELPHLRPRPQPRDLLHAGTRRGRVHDGEHGGAKLSARARCCSGTSERRRTAEADASWATRLERKSHDRGQPTQIIGWTGGIARQHARTAGISAAGGAMDERAGSGAARGELSPTRKARDVNVSPKREARDARRPRFAQSGSGGTKYAWRRISACLFHHLDHLRKLAAWRRAGMVQARFAHRREPRSGLARCRGAHDGGRGRDPDAGPAFARG